MDEQTTANSKSMVFLLTGMSRSGTSMAASLLQAGGANMGDRQLMAHAGNSKGHFENMDFLEFHRAALRDEGQHDGGWVSSGSMKVSEARRAEARTLIEVNAAAAGPAGWGWKDPRTSLFLDFWHELLPDAQCIFIYRSPWEVVDSIFRRGVSEDMYFRDKPEEAVRVWAHYNRCILDFMRRHPEKSVLVAHDAVTARPDAFIRLINERHRATLKEPPAGIVEPGMLHRQSLGGSRPTLIARAFPEALDLLVELDAACSLRALEISPEAIAGVRKANDYSTFFHDWFEGHMRARLAAKGTRLQRFFRLGRKKKKKPTAGD